MFVLVSKAASLYEKVTECRSLEKAGNGDQNLTAVVKRKSLTRTAKHDPAYLHCPIPQFPDQIVSIFLVVFFFFCIRHFLN